MLKNVLGFLLQLGLAFPDFRGNVTPSIESFPTPRSPRWHAGYLGRGTLIVGGRVNGTHGSTRRRRFKSFKAKARMN